jgi:hypothetical protein
MTKEPKQMKVLSTKAIRLTRSKPIVAVNLMLPPGINTFYVERLTKNEIRFIIPEDEITRLEDKKHKINKKNGFEVKELPKQLEGKA